MLAPQNILRQLIDGALGLVRKVRGGVAGELGFGQELEREAAGLPCEFVKVHWHVVAQQVLVANLGVRGISENFGLALQ